MYNFFRHLLSYFQKPPVRAIRWNPPIHAANWIGENPSILILKLDHIGDFITAFEAFGRIRAAWPNSKITLVCAPINVPLAERLNYFDKIVPFTLFPPSSQITDRETVDLKRKLKEFSQLNLGHFDIAIDLRHDGDTRPLLFQVSAFYRAGYPSHLLQQPLDITLPEVENSARSSRTFLPLHAELRLTLLAEFVIMTLKRSERSLSNRLALNLNEPDSTQGRYFVFSVSSGKPIRKWPIERAKELCARLISETGYTLVIVGGPEETQDAAIISDGLKPEKYSNLIGQLPVVDLAPVLAKAALVIGYDTGVTHFAAYLGVPTLGIYAAVSDINVWAPLGEKVTMLRYDVPCSPCYLREISECKFERICLTSISVDEAFVTAMNILSEKNDFSPHTTEVRLTSLG